MRTTRLHVFISIISALSCGDAGPAALHDLAASPTAALVQNEWQTWPISFPPDQCAAGFKSGSVDTHLVTTSRVLRDGSVETGAFLNLRNGRVTDASGNEYVFAHNSRFRQVMTAANTFVAEVVDRFRIISKGVETNEFVEITMRIEWDGVQFIVTAIYSSTCRG